MSNNLANLMVGFGLDLSALQKDAPEAFRILNSQTLGMTAEMKRASREGAESFRLIDEALGIHLSRPLTRIIAQEFPAFAKGMQSLLGAGVVGALGVGLFEGFEHIARSVEHAHKAEEDFTKSVEHTQDVVGDLAAEHARTMKEIGMQLAEQEGQPGAKQAAVYFRIDTAALDEAKRQIGEIAGAMDKESKAAIEAGRWTTKFWDAVGYVGANFFSSSAAEEENASKRFEEFHRVLEEIMRASSADPLAGLRESLKRVDEEMNTTGAEIAAKMALWQHQQSVGFTFDVPGQQRKQPPVDPVVLASEQKYFEMLKQQGLALAHIIEEDQGHRLLAAGISDEAERQLKAQQEIAALTKEMAASIVKLQPETDPIKKLDQEIESLRTKAATDFEAIGQAAQAGLLTDREFGQASAAIDAYEKKLDQLKVKLESEIFATQARDLLNKPGVIAPPQVQQLPTSISSTPAAPALGPGGTAGAQFDAFSQNEAAQTALLKQAFADVVTPQEKFLLTEKELNLVLKDANGEFIAGVAGQAAWTAAMQKARDAMVEAENHLHKMQEDLQKLLERSDDASAGIQAFFLQLEINAGENGKFAFDMLNSALKGFEDQTASAIFTGKTHWKDYFRSLAEEAFKFIETKEIAGLFQMISGTGIGKSLSGLIPGGGAAGGGGGGVLSGLSGATGGMGSGASLAAAAATLQTGSTTLMAAATELQAAASSLFADSAGGGEADDFSGIIPGYAEGTDYAPGGLSWVGERGPELLNLPTGSSVTPAANVKGGGDTHVYQDFRGAVVTDDLMRKADAAKMSMITKRQAVGEALANFSEIQKRSLQSR